MTGIRATGRRVDFGTSTPKVAATAWVAPLAVLIGDVTVRSGAGVYFGAVIRGDLAPIVIGERSNVQDNVTLHADPGHPLEIGKGVSIGHNAVLHGCTVEDDCLIGMSATIMNGSKVGRGSLVAAGAVVLEGTDIPAGSLVAGVPAKVRRALTSEEIKAISANAETYTALTERYRSA